MATEKLTRYLIGQHPQSKVYHITHNRNPVCGADTSIFERLCCIDYSRYITLHWSDDTKLCPECFPRGRPHAPPSKKDLRWRAERLLSKQPPPQYSLFHLDTVTNIEHFLATDTLDNLSLRFFQKRHLTKREMFDLSFIVTHAGDVKGIYRRRAEWLLRHPSDYRAPEDMRGSGRAPGRWLSWAEAAPERTKIENYQ